MKSKIHSLSESFKPVILYREDIEAIIAVLHEVSETVEMSNDEYEFNSDEEWLGVKINYFTHLKISSSRPYIIVDLKEWNANLYVVDDAPASRGAYEKIKEILQSRERKAYTLVTSWTSYSLIGLCSFTSGLILKSTAHYVAIGILMILVSGIGFWAYRIDMRRHSLIYPKFRSDAPSFWQRNSDSIIIAVTAAIIGAVIGSIVTVLAK